MSKPFVVPIGGLRNSDGARLPLEAESALDELFVQGSHVPEDSIISFTGGIEAMMASDQAVVTGTITASWVGDCRRCTNDAEGAIQVEVREVFEPKAVEGDTYPLATDRVELEAMIREAIMLELPEAPLCKEDCLGLCPECGVDRNETPCDCETQVVDLRWAALDNLKTN